MSVGHWSHKTLCSASVWIVSSINISSRVWNQISFLKHRKLRDVRGSPFTPLCSYRDDDPANDPSEVTGRCVLTIHNKTDNGVSNERAKITEIWPLRMTLPRSVYVFTNRCIRFPSKQLKGHNILFLQLLLSLLVAVKTNACKQFSLIKLWSTENNVATKAFWWGCMFRAIVSPEPAGSNSASVLKKY